MKPWWEYLLSLLAGLWTKDQLAKAGAPPDALAVALTTRVDLPTFGDPADIEERRQREAVVAFMRSQLGKSYKLGVEVQPGQESDDWDCSEVVESAFRLASLYIPDGSPMQYDHCRPVAPGREKAGDLHFLWSDKWGRIGHVMVDTGEGTLVHAVGGRGVVEDLASQWTGHARYRGCRRHPDFALPVSDRPSPGEI